MTYQVCLKIYTSTITRVGETSGSRVTTRGSNIKGTVTNDRGPLLEEIFHSRLNLNFIRHNQIHIL